MNGPLGAFPFAMSAVICLLLCSFSYLTYSDIKAFSCLCLHCVVLHTANEKSIPLILHLSTVLHVLTFKFSPVNDFC